MDRNRVQMAAIAAVVLVLIGNVLVMIRLNSAANALEGAPPERTAVSAPSPILLQYQGRLGKSGAGDAVEDGSYTMTLRLYDKAAAGKPLWTETKDVAVRDGLFSTALGDTTPLNQNLFNGRALWLGVKVGADDEAAPRQQVLPVAYALGIVPGAAVQGSGSKAALTLSNTGSGEALYAKGPVTIEGGLSVSGAIDNAGIVTQYEFDDHIYGGLHNGRALAFATIDQDCSIRASSGNVSCSWNNLGKYFEITIEGHTYDWRNYVTVVTPVLGGITSAWSLDGKLLVGIYMDASSPGMKTPFHFVTFAP